MSDNYKANFLIFERIKNRVLISINTQYLYYKNLRIYNSVANPRKTLYVPIDSINLKVKKSKFIKDFVPGSILDGDWDIKAIDLKSDYENNTKHRGIVEHFVYGIPWEKTILFQERYSRLLEKKGQYRGCTSLNELARKYESKIDVLYNKIKKSGMLPRSIRNPHIAPIYMFIGRNGEFIYTTEGNHRLSIAMILGIKYIPVRIYIRHSKWQNIRDQLYNNIYDIDENNFLKLKKHPDLQDIINKRNYKSIAYLT